MKGDKQSMLMPGQASRSAVQARSKTVTKSRLEIMSQAAALDHVELEGLAVHIGSQLTDLSPYAAAFSRLAELFQAARDAGHAMKRLDLGGGIGISYEEGTPPDFPAYAEIARKAVGHLGIPLIFEPGRAIVGHVGL